MTQKASETKHMTAQHGGGYKMIDDSTHDINHRYDAAWPKEARILSALDPAPDHDTWNAAIEAAAKVALDQEVACSKWFMQTGQHCNVYEQLPIAAERIRALKKGTPQ